MKEPLRNSFIKDDTIEKYTSITVIPWTVVILFSLWASWDNENSSIIFLITFVTAFLVAVPALIFVIQMTVTGRADPFEIYLCRKLSPLIAGIMLAVNIFIWIMSNSIGGGYEPNPNYYDAAASLRGDRKHAIATAENGMPGITLLHIEMIEGIVEYLRGIGPEKRVMIDMISVYWKSADDEIFSSVFFPEEDKIDILTFRGGLDSSDEKRDKIIERRDLI